VGAEIPQQARTIDCELRRERSPARRIEILKTALADRVTIDSLDWIFDLVEVVRRTGVNREVVRRVCSDLAWRAREIGQPMPDAAEWNRCSETAQPQEARRILAYVHGSRLRFDFRFEELDSRVSRWREDLRDDALIAAFAAFAALGLHAAKAKPLLQAVQSAQDYDSVCRHVCLQGLWFGTHLPDQADRIISLSDEIIGRGEAGPNVYYWRASALRRLGRLDEALHSVDRAIAMLPVGMNAVHQDYFRERELITSTQWTDEQIRGLGDEVSAQLRAEFSSYLEDIRKEFEAESQQARRLVSDSLLSLVEVLGLFVTLAGFLIGSGAVVLSADGFGEKAGAVALLLAGSVGFFLLMRTVVRFEKGRRSSQPARASSPRRDGEE